MVLPIRISPSAAREVVAQPSARAVASAAMAGRPPLLHPRGLGAGSAQADACRRRSLTIGIVSPVYGGCFAPARQGEDLVCLALGPSVPTLAVTGAPSHGRNGRFPSLSAARIAADAALLPPIPARPPCCTRRAPWPDRAGCRRHAGSPARRHRRFRRAGTPPAHRPPRQAG